MAVVLPTSEEERGLVEVPRPLVSTLVLNKHGRDIRNRACGPYFEGFMPGIPTQRLAKIAKCVVLLHNEE